MSSEDNNLHIREIFSILTQGVEMIQYEANPVTGTSSVTGKIVWMDSDIYRICIDTVRPSMADRAQGKIPTGLYLRDISEVRDGSDAFQFTHNKSPPRESDNCLTLVGSERTIALELPSKFTRDWFLSRFRLLTEDILVEQEKKIRRYKFWENSRHLTEMEKSGADHLTTLLESGIQILHHQRNGKIDKSILKFDSHNLNLEIHSVTKPFFSFWMPQPLRISVYDVSEVRPGSHSLGFVKTGSTEFDSETMSLVGSENVFDLQLINNTARDLFAERIFHFILMHRLSRRAQHTGRDEYGVQLVA